MPLQCEKIRGQFDKLGLLNNDAGEGKDRLDTGLRFESLDVPSVVDVCDEQAFFPPRKQLRPHEVAVGVAA